MDSTWIVVAILLVGVYAALMAYTVYLKTFYKGKRLPSMIPTYYLPFGLDLLFERIFLVDDAEDVKRLIAFTRTYGPNFNFLVLNRRVIVLNEPEALIHVLAKNFDNYIKGPELEGIFHDFLGEGIFNSDGDAWKDQRSIAKTHFLRDDLEAMIPIFIKHSHEVVDILSEHESSGQPVEMQDLFLRFTMDAAGEILFNNDFGTLKVPSPFAKAFDSVQKYLQTRFDNPAWRIVESVLGRGQYDKNIETITSICNEIARKALADPHINERTDLLAHFIKSNAIEGREDSIKYLRDMCMNFLIAGRDTTGVLLSWAVLMIVEHPEVEQKLVEEIEQVIGFERDPTADDIRSLKYMKIFIYEVLRLYPSVPMNMRFAKEDDYLPSGHIVPKDTSVVWSQYILSRLHPFFGEDAEEFKPERWGPERVNEIRPFYWTPFHAGPRTCLGMNMAQNEAKVMLTLLLQRFRLKKAPNHRITLNKAIILSSSSGNHMNVIKR